MSSTKVVVPADLTWVKVNGGRGFANMVNWDLYDEGLEDPVPGQHVVAADGGSQRLDAVIAEVRTDGTLVLDFPTHTRASA